MNNKRFIKLDENNRVRTILFIPEDNPAATKDSNVFESPVQDSSEVYIGLLYDSNENALVHDEETDKIISEEESRRAEAKIRKKRKISVTEFKMRLKPKERVAIKESTDPLVTDFLDLIEDSRVTVVNMNLSSVEESIEYVVNYLSEQGIVDNPAVRKKEILSGSSA